MNNPICIPLVLLPALAALVCWKGKFSDKQYLNLMGATAILHFLLACSAFPLRSKNAGIFLLDIPACTLLMLTSLLFLFVTLHSRFWFFAETNSRESAENPTAIMSCRIFTACLLGFLATMTLVLVSDSMGLMWVAIEATTLVSAPLILFHRSKRSLEAMWKYLLICSVGIGLALIGIMFLAVAVSGSTLSFSNILTTMTYTMHPGWFKAAFIMAVVGFGTKMGLAPFHTWLPDAHSEAPGTVSALLSAALLNCSFLAIYRMLAMAPPAAKTFCMEILVILGILSLAVAALFIIGQDDYKRMLAYSSVEHMGLIALFAGLGVDVWLIHVMCHSIIKMTLFLLAGNFLLAYGTRQMSRLGGLMKTVPKNASLFILGTVLICGMPPSPLFFTELELIRHAPKGIAFTIAALLFLLFAGMTRNVMKLTLGPTGELQPDDHCARAAERLVVIPIAAIAITLLPFVCRSLSILKYL